MELCSTKTAGQLKSCALESMSSKILEQILQNLILHFPPWKEWVIVNINRGTTCTDEWNRLRGNLNKYKSSHNGTGYMGCLILCQLEKPGISSQNILSSGRQNVKNRKMKQSRIDLYEQAYLLKEGRGRGDLTKYNTTFFWSSASSTILVSTKVNTSNVPQKMGRNSGPRDKNCLILFFAGSWLR